MSQERLDDLAIISIEQKCAKDTDFDQEQLLYTFQVRLCWIKIDSAVNLAEKPSASLVTLTDTCARKSRRAVC